MVLAGPSVVEVDEADGVDGQKHGLRGDGAGDATRVGRSET